MVRLRIAGILLVVIALAAGSLAIAQSKKQPVDINSATEAEIVVVGIDKAVAKKIIDARPYRNKTELVSRQLLTREQCEKLKDSLIARQPPKPMK